MKILHNLKINIFYLFLPLLIGLNFNTKAQSQKISGATTFGYETVVNGDFLAIGTNTQNTVTVYQKDVSGTWILKQSLASEVSEDIGFGTSISIYGNYMVIGASKEKDAAKEMNNVGSVYVYKYNQITETWEIQQKLTAPYSVLGLNFGWSVAIHGDHIVVSARGDKTDANNGGTSYSNCGAVYLFKLNTVNNEWEYKQKIVATHRASNLYFGGDLSVSNQYFVVGAYGDKLDDSGANSLSSNAGSVYLYKFNTDGTASYIKKITTSDRTASVRFGYSVAISNNTFVVGAEREKTDENQQNSLNQAGAAYIFNINPADDQVTTVQKIVAPDRAETDKFGVSVSINESYIVVGANEEDEDDANPAANTLNNAGSAYLFKYNANTTRWENIKKIVADTRKEAAQYGHNVSIHGDYILVGSYQAGEAFVYQISVITPVTLTSYTAKANGNNALLQWATASESNNSHFIVEHSTNGKEFTLLTTVNSEGDKGSNYAYTHSNPSAGINYYRLSQQDYDGTVEFLGVQAVNFSFNGVERSVVVYPNPVEGNTFMIKAHQEGIVPVIITDMSGKVVVKQTVTFNNHTAEVVLPSVLNPGIYILNAENTGSVKLIVK